MDKNIAILPLRAGSKGIPHKNRKKVLGRPLFCWVLGEAALSNLDKVYVFTDDPWIMDYVNKEYAWSDKIKPIARSAESAIDTAGTEQAMWELAEKINFNFENYVLLQATSPLTSAHDINKAILKLEEYDSVISLVKTHRFIWDEQGGSLNYDYMNRPRRQDFKGLLIENGAIYACEKTSYLATKNRLGGNIGHLLMPEDTLIEIDEPSDFIVIEQLLSQRLIKQKGAPKTIKYLVLDVDGVFTPANVHYTEHGEFSKAFSFVDGMGLEILRDHGIQPIVMTSEDSGLVKSRMQKLKIDHVYTGVRDKFTFVNHLLPSLGVNRSQIAYVGDDINDMANMVSVGWSLCPANAVDDIKSVADIHLQRSGGYGAIREAVEFMVNYNKRFE